MIRRIYEWIFKKVRCKRRSLSSSGLMELYQCILPRHHHGPHQAIDGFDGKRLWFK
jgi:hypothetical protein